MDALFGLMYSLIYKYNYNVITMYIKYRSIDFFFPDIYIFFFYLNLKKYVYVPNQSHTAVVTHLE